MIRWNATNDGDDTEVMLESIGAQSTSAPVLLHTPGTFRGMSRDNTHVVTQRSDPYRALLWNTASGEKIAEIPVPENKLPLYLSDKNIELSRTGQYLLLYDQVYDWNAKSPTLQWECPTHSPGYFNAGVPGDERHIVVRRGDRYEVWDWREKQKRMTIYLLPEEKWLMFNHETHCWNNSPGAYPFMELLHRDAKDSKEWITPYRYISRAKWENDHTNAGLDAPSGESR
jgi:hypothetical protein